MKSFESLKIGDKFTTAAGTWVVWDKGTKTLQAYKLPLEAPGVIDEQVITFFTYDFGN